MAEINPTDLQRVLMDAIQKEYYGRTDFFQVYGWPSNETAGFRAVVDTQVFTVIVVDSSR